MATQLSERKHGARRRTSSSDRPLLARGQLPRRSARSTCSTTRCSREPLTLEHVKPRLLGHWGTTPGLNFIYVHLNRVIKEHDLEHDLHHAAPATAGPALVANTYLEGTYSELYPDVSQDEEGMRRLFKQFSFPGGIPSHVGARDARLDPRGRRARLRALARLRGRVRQPRPDRRLRRRRRRGRDRARWRRAGTRTSSSTRRTDGAVLPILHLNGYKIANPTVLARIGREELEQPLRGYGYKPYFVEGDDPATMHRLMAEHARRGRRRDPAIQARRPRATASPSGPAGR